MLPHITKLKNGVLLKTKGGERQEKGRKGRAKKIRGCKNKGETEKRGESKREKRQRKGKGKKLTGFAL